MGTNARKRHGPIDTTPKVGTPIAERAVPEVFTSKLGWHPSKRELKKRERHLEILNPSTPE